MTDDFKQHVKQVALLSDRQAAFYQSAWSNLDRNQFLNLVLSHIDMAVGVEVLEVKDSKAESSAATNGFVSNKVTLQFPTDQLARQFARKLNELRWAA